MPADLPPDLLVEKLARLEGVCCRTCAEEALTALAEWADGALIDRNWTRWDRSDEAGVDYCRAHAGLRNEDESACDVFVGCSDCYGEGSLETGDDAEPFVDCPLCGGSGVDPCDLVPLYTLTPRED